MVKPMIVIEENGEQTPPQTFSVPRTQGTLLSERMGMPRREIPSWARSFDWSAEEDDDE